MSEQQNVALIQKLLEAFGRGDIQTIVDHCTSDCQFYCPGPDAVPFTGRKNGPEEIRASYFDPMLSTQNNANLRVDQFIAQGDTVVVIGNYTADIKETGKTVDSPVALIFDIKDGRVSRHMVIGDTAALAASYTK
jgi:ketosteroid isomerase-like protein